MAPVLRTARLGPGRHLDTGVAAPRQTVHHLWHPTPMQLAVAATVWPQAVALATTIAVIAATWLIRALTAPARRIRRGQGRHR